MTKKEIDPSARIQLIVGVLGLIGVLLTVFVPIIRDNIKQSNQPTQTPIIIVATPTQAPVIPTDTVPAGDPTSTPASATNTPEPTFTLTAVPTLEAGKDWQQNCISTVWQVFPASQSVSNKDGCYINFISGFSVRDQRLLLSILNKTTTEELVGMFVEIPPNALIDLNIHLDNIEAGEVRVGIFQEPDVNKPGVMVVAPEGNPNNSAFAVHSMPANKREYISDKFKKDTGDYLITFDIVSGNVVVKFEKYTSVKPIEVLADANGKKWLFIGYKTFAGKSNTLEANFFDLVITSR